MNESIHSIENFFLGPPTFLKRDSQYVIETLLASHITPTPIIIRYQGTKVHSTVKRVGVVSKIFPGFEVVSGGY
jgi:hypothetical protein